MIVSVVNENNNGNTLFPHSNIRIQIILLTVLIYRLTIIQNGFPIILPLHSGHCIL